MYEYRDIFQGSRKAAGDITLGMDFDANQIEMLCKALAAALDMLSPALPDQITARKAALKTHIDKFGLPMPGVAT